MHDPLVTQVNLASDVPGLAPLFDPDLVNPWGAALTSTSPLWVANQGTDSATVYSLAAGSDTVAKSAAVRVTLPGWTPLSGRLSGVNADARRWQPMPGMGRGRRDVPEQLSEEEKAAYRALVRVVLAAPRAVTADITLDCGLGLSQYVALEALSEAPGRRLRMAELAATCGVSVSGITRVIDRLESEGLTARVDSPGDARVIVAVLTEAGQARLGKARLAHLASVRRHFLDHLGDVDLARFTSSMERIADSLLGRTFTSR
ncbi:MAG TPA: MarR family transcriptional regulator [Trebonia sp.]|nr:MarR family transcriptional regulator [Trebonia sp.]